MRRDVMANVTNSSSGPIAVRDLGRMAYEPAWGVQRQTHADVLAGKSPETVLFVEHEPVVTIGRHPGAAEHLVASPELLAQHGVSVCPTNRGGDITYHGPGQIVAYPVIRLQDRQLNLRRYVNRLEQSIIDTLAEFGIDAARDDSAIGVWTPEGKIAAIGVRAEKWVTLHGLALNVRPNLAHFQLIVPCGLAGRPVTSVAQLLGDDCPTTDEVRGVLTNHLTRNLNT